MQKIVTMNGKKYKIFKSPNELYMVSGKLFNWEIITQNRDNTGPLYLVMYLNDESNTNILYDIKNNLAKINNTTFNLRFTDLETFASSIVDKDGKALKISPLYKK